MAYIPKLSIINENKIQALNIARDKDSHVLLTADEVKEILRGFITEELGYFSEDFSKKRKLEVEERLNFKLKQFENSMIRHVDDKINNITEKIVELLLNRKIEEEVEKRLNKKLDKLKKTL